MTEAQWLACGDVDRLLERLQPRQRARKMRLFACACCRQIWDHLTHPNLRDAIEVSERFADGGATAGQLRAARVRVRRVLRRAEAADERYWRELRETAATGAAPPPHDPAARFYALAADEVTFKEIGVVVWAARALQTATRVADAPERDQVGLLRDVFGNPFRPIAFLSAWRSATVTTLAGQMYEARDFSAMPILADALEDAGCDNAAVLDHCRGPGPHVRGCWVVDSVLGRE